MICEKCGKEITEVLVNEFNWNGSDSDNLIPIIENPEGNGAVIVRTTHDWTGDNLSAEEQVETIRCPYCKQFPFKNEEIQAYEVVELVMFPKTHIETGKTLAELLDEEN